MPITPNYPENAYSQRSDAVIADEPRTYLRNSVSWGAIIAGVMTALVIQVLLNLLGVGVGAASLDAANLGDNPTASGFSTNAGIWWVVSGIIASFLGGVVAGRLCGAGSANTARWHGFVSWATATLVLLVLLTSAVGGLVGGTFSALGSTLGGVGKAATSAVGGVASSGDGTALEAQVHQLVSPNDAQSAQSDVVSYVKTSLGSDQNATNAARDKAVNSLAKAANISPDEARSRLDQLTQQAKQTADQAKDKAQQAAEATRKAVASGGMYGSLVLLLGAIAGWLGGGIGAPRREVRLA